MNRCRICGVETTRTPHSTWCPNRPNPNAQIVSVNVTCQLCLEPCVDVNGEWLHVFTGKPQCTYRSHL